MQNHKVIIVKDLKFVQIRAFDSLVFKDIELADAVILEYEASKTYRILKLIRSYHLPKVSLIPIVILKNNKKDLEGKVSESVKKTSDFIIGSVNRLERLVSHIDKINSLCRRFYNLPLAHEIEIINVLRYVISRENRDNKLVPIINSRCLIGYEYPIVEFQYKKNDYKSVFDILRRAVEYGLLVPKFKDTIHICPTCFSGFHNIREVCPSCQSGDLKSESTIHHFVCANISPMSEYVTSSGKLLCPQCDRYLNNIGIDYDKPSFVYQCNNCDYQFQEPGMQSFCYHCETVAKIEELKQIKIYEYEVTKKGVYFANTGKGIDGLLTSETVKEGFMSHNTFVTLFKLEKRKALQQDGELISCSFHIESPDPIGDSTKDELCNEIRSMSPEYVSIYANNTRFSFLFPETFMYEDIVALYQFNSQHILDWLKARAIPASIKGSVVLLKTKGKEVVKIKLDNFEDEDAVTPIQ